MAPPGTQKQGFSRSDCAALGLEKHLSAGSCETVVESLAVYIRFLGVRPVSWQGYRWWITSLSYSSIPPPGYLLLFLCSNSTPQFFFLLILFSIIDIFTFWCPLLSLVLFLSSLSGDSFCETNFRLLCPFFSSLPLFILKIVLEIKTLACLSLDLALPSWGFPTIIISPHSDLRDSLMLVFG